MQEKRVLDITTFKEKGAELHTAIENAVKSTQQFVVQPLPDWLLMKQSQFKDLARLHNMGDMFDSEERMYITKHNIMQIEIADKVVIDE